MLRAHLVTEKTCYDHPHRVVRTACARCKTAYCDECLTTQTDGLFAKIVEDDEKAPPPLFCARCVEEVEALNVREAYRKRPLLQRLTPSRAGINRIAIYLAAVAILLVPMAFAVRGMAGTTLTPEELGRIRRGLIGSFQTRDGTNMVSNVIGGTFIRASAPSRSDNPPSRLIDEFAAVEVPGWRSHDATLPVDLVFAIPARTRVNRIILRAQPAEPEGTWVRDFEVLASNSPDAGFTSLVSGTFDVGRAKTAVNADLAAPSQSFDFPDSQAHYVMLRVFSNQGSRDYTSLGEFEVYWYQK